MNNIPEDFVGMPPDMDVCVTEECKNRPEWGRVYCRKCMELFRFSGGGKKW